MKAPAIAPCLGVKDTQASVDFYEKLGFTALPAGNDPNDDIRSLLFGDEFALMVYRDAHLRDWLPVLKDRTPGAFGMFYLAVDNFDAYVEKIRPLVEATKEATHEGVQLFYFTDPDGYVIGVTQKKEW